MEAMERSRNIDTVTLEIKTLQKQAEGIVLSYAIEIGRRLVEAKAMLPHGGWGDWLKRELNYSQSTAQNFMRVFKEYGADQQSLFGGTPKSQALGDLSYTKALRLLAIPDEEERGRFIDENDVGGMTSRELERAIRERDEARTAAEAAKADARSAEESRAKMEQDMKALKGLLCSAQDTESRTRDALSKAQAELQALRDKPVEVAVQTVVDEEAVKKAAQEAADKMQAKVDELSSALKEAEGRRKEAEEALKEAEAKAEGNADALSRAEKAERELAEARRALEAAEKAEKTAEVNADPDLAMFNVLFDQTKEQVNRMHGLRMKIGKGDEAMDGKLKAAINALADAVRRCAE